MLLTILSRPSRVTTIAKFLIDGDPNGKMTRSVADLQKHDRVECKRLAAKYSKQLFDIYKKRNDPLFSPLSTDLLYKSTSATGREYVEHPNPTVH